MTITHRLSKLSFAVASTLYLVVGCSLLTGCAPSTVSEPTASEPTVSETTASEPTQSVETTASETSPSRLPGTSTEPDSPSSNAEEPPTNVETRSDEANSEANSSGASEASVEESAALSNAPLNELLSEEERAVTERLADMGIENPEAVKTFLADMRAAASSQNQEAIADLVRYPFTTYDTGEPLKTYESSAALLEDFNQVVTPTVIEAMRNAQYSELFSNYQGVMIGNGEVWFDQVDQSLKIRAINGDS